MFCILDKNNDLIQVNKVLDWASWFESHNRIVKKDFITYIDGSEVEVSTVFIGAYDQLFETMIFGGKYDGCQKRYGTYADALAGHEQALKTVIKSNKKSIFVRFKLLLKRIRNGLMF